MGEAFAELGSISSPRPAVNAKISLSVVLSLRLLLPGAATPALIESVIWEERGVSGCLELEYWN